MHVVFFTEGSHRSGMGHLLRCLALAQTLKARNHKVTFVLDPASTELANSRMDWVGDIATVIQNFTPITWDELSLYSFATIDWVIIDSYGVHDSFFSSARQFSGKIALFDDLTYEKFDCIDVLINSAIEPDESAYYYQNNDSVFLALGCDYLLLRAEFTSVEPIPIVLREYVTICFGGADLDNLTVKALRLLSKNWDVQKIRVVTGPAYSHLDELEEMLKRLNDNRIVHQHNVQNMASIWNSSRLVVSAGGGAQFELKACHTPAILVVVAENQKVASMNSQAHGWCRTLIYEGNKAIFWAQLTDLYASLVGDEDCLLGMQKMAAKNTLSNGAARLSRLLETEQIEKD